MVVVGGVGLPVIQLTCSHYIYSCSILDVQSHQTLDSTGIFQPYDLVTFIPTMSCFGHMVT